MSADIPAGDAQDNDYVSRTGQKDHIPVQSDNATVEDPIDPATADSDATLGVSLYPSHFQYCSRLGELTLTLIRRGR